MSISLILSQRDAAARCSLSPNKLRSLESIGLFPKRVHLSDDPDSKAFGYVAEEVDAYIQRRIQLRDENLKGVLQ